MWPNQFLEGCHVTKNCHVTKTILQGVFFSFLEPPEKNSGSAPAPTLRETKDIAAKLTVSRGSCDQDTTENKMC